MKLNRMMGLLATVSVLALTAVLYLSSCAPVAVDRKITPEQEKAKQDSLAQIHKLELQKLWSFGYEHYKQANYDRAKGYFLQIAEKDTGGIYGRLLYQRIGYCYLQTGKPDSAEWAYKKGLEKLPNDTWLLSQLGFICRTQKRYDEALPIYQRLITLEPDSANHHKFLGQIYYFGLNEAESALPFYEKAVALNPKDIESQDTLTDIYKKIGDPHKMIETLTTMLVSKPDDLSSRVRLAESYLKVGEYEKAVEQCELVLAKEPQNIMALELMGESYNNLKNFNKALETYKKILAFQPEDKKNICNLANCYIELGQYTTALAQVSKALSVDPNYGLAFITRGMAYEKSADRCSEKNKGKTTFDDKLVYKMAYDEYQKARRDLTWRGEAETRISYVSAVIPTDSDYFMHPNQKSPRSACYDWIR